MRLHEHRDLLRGNTEEVLKMIEDFRAHLVSPKFTGDDDLSDYINVRDVDARLLEMRAVLLDG